MHISLVQQIGKSLLVVCLLFELLQGQVLASNIASSAQPIVVLLSPDELVSQQVNEQLLIGVRREMPTTQPYFVIAMDDFADLKTAWQAVLQLNPQLVIGPLHKQNIEQLVALDPTVPVVALNRVAAQHPLIWQIDVAAIHPLAQLKTHLLDNDIHNLLLLSHYSDKANDAYQQLSSDDPAHFHIESIIYQRKDELLAALYALTEYTSNRQRVEGLQQLVVTPFVTRHWFRQDADAMVLLMPLADALEVVNQLRYIGHEDLPVFWLDTAAAPLSQFVRARHQWPWLYTLLPQFYVTAMQSNNAVDDNWFTALGEDSIKLALQLERLNAAHDVSIEGSLGKLSLHQNHIIRIDLPLVELNGK